MSPEVTTKEHEEEHSSSSTPWIIVTVVLLVLLMVVGLRHLGTSPWRRGTSCALFVGVDAVCL